MGMMVTVLVMATLSAEDVDGQGRLVAKINVDPGRQGKYSRWRRVQAQQSQCCEGAWSQAEWEEIAPVPEYLSKYIVQTLMND